MRHDLLKIHPFSPKRDPNGKGVVLLHGLGASVRMWHHLIQALVRNGYSVMAVDVLGLNQSPDIDRQVTMKDHVDYVDRTVRHCQEQYRLQEVYGIGCSFGGQILVCANHAHPSLFRRVVVVNAPLLPPKEMLVQMKKTLMGKVYHCHRPIRNVPIIPFIERRQRLLRVAKRFSNWLTDHSLTEHIDDLFASKRFWNYFVNTERVILKNRARFCLNHSNVCLVYSLRDTYMPLESVLELKRNNPRATVTFIDSLKHNPFIDPAYQKEVVRDMIALLNDPVSSHSCGKVRPIP
jgi:pimeloyl-ACP methyl ester carboxylesterase